MVTLRHVDNLEVTPSFQQSQDVQLSLLSPWLQITIPKRNFSLQLGLWWWWWQQFNCQPHKNMHLKTHTKRSKKYQLVIVYLIFRQLNFCPSPGADRKYANSTLPIHKETPLCLQSNWWLITLINLHLILLSSYFFCCCLLLLQLCRSLF